jgi:hypothetical protein
VDLVLDPATGTLHAYVMDAHAERALRIAQTTIDLTLRDEGGEFLFKLEAQADPLSGETVGDTSHFKATARSLQGRRTFEGRLGAVTVRGVEHPATPFRYDPHGAE